jgi:glycosidase
VDEQEGDPSSTLQISRQLLDIRRRHAALRDGALRLIADDPSVLVLERTSDAEQVCCVFNLSSEAAQHPLPVGGWHSLVGNARIEGGILRLPPYGYAWLIAGAEASA